VRRSSELDRTAIRGMSLSARSRDAGPPSRQLRLAVLIPVYNAQPALECSLLSLAEDGAEFEVFVVDDGSAPALTVPEGLPFPVRWFRLPHNQGITKALNVGLEAILQERFEYVGRLDAGDISLPGRFDAQMAFLDEHPDHAVVGTYADMIDEEGGHLHAFRPPTRHDALMRQLYYRNPMCHPSVMMRTAALRAVGLYADDYPGSEDYEMWLRLSRTWKLANLDQVSVRKEETRSSITARRLRLGISRLRLQFAHFDPRSIHAYLGIARSLALLLISRGMLLRLMRLQPSSRPS